MSSHTPSSGSKSRRWGRRSKRDDSPDIASVGYVPPTLDAPADVSAQSEGTDRFVTSPPRRTGLTGNITSLFRRPGSKEPGHRNRSNSPRKSSNYKRSDSNSTGLQNEQDPPPGFVAGQEGGDVLDGLIRGAIASPRRKTPSSTTANPGAANSPGFTKTNKKRLSPKSKKSKKKKAAVVGSSPGSLTQNLQRLNDQSSGVRTPRSQRSVGSRGSRVSKSSRGSNRIFYSAQDDDDDSDDSYDSRGSDSKSTKSRNRSRDSVSADLSGATGSETLMEQAILRYRGFSTSIRSLFLDESLVCASIGCFGLVLSNRTEYLLQIRNERRGVRWGRAHARRTLPSRIVAYALLLTIVLIFSTFVFFGFGNNQAVKSQDFYDTSDYGDGDDWAQQQQQNNDDGGNVQYVDDQYYQDDGNNDDGGNNDNDDAAAANDDGGGNDDAAAANDDGGNDNNDDAATANYDDYYNAGDDDVNNRRLRRAEMFILQNGSYPSIRQSHRRTGVFKIRDMNEGIWLPAIDYISYEWNRDDDNTDWQPKDARKLENQNYDGYQSDTNSHRDLATTLRLSFFLGFIVVLGILGRRRRMRTRYYIVRARAQEDHLFYASSGIDTKRPAFHDTKEDQFDGACSHTLCGCYPIDPPSEDYEVDDQVEVTDDGILHKKKKHHHDDCIARLFNIIVGCCCGCMCKCWFQCLSICALAQEAREIRLLVPTRYQRIDVITHQPFHEYQKVVNDLRLGWLGKMRKKSGIMPHFHALSRLSRYILAIFVASSLSIVASLVFNPNSSFAWPDAVVLLATFLQSFFVILFAYWLFHKSDLSLDAVIKFFAAGFLIAIPSAFFFEGVMVNITLISAWLVYITGEAIKGEAFETWVGKNYYLMWIVGELISAYIIAATTEEICKYYTFRCVEHPDLLFLTGLDRNANDDRAVEGGLVKYPFSSHQVQNTNKLSDDASVGASSRASHRSKVEEDEDDEMDEDVFDVRTHRQRAAAVTTGMICVAVGLACAENFLYVFLLGGSSDIESAEEGHPSGVAEEWIVLLFRSIFPVHALAAAMQSVNMIRKFVELSSDKTHRIGIGRIVMPAILMHGTFDAVLLLINVYIEASWDAYLEANDGNIQEGDVPYNVVALNIFAMMSVSTVMLSGIVWYYRENRAQRLRLILLEEEEKARNGNIAYRSPSSLKQHNSAVELV